jgi:hypothetical protein
MALVNSASNLGLFTSSLINAAGPFVDFFPGGANSSQAATPLNLPNGPPRGRGEVFYRKGKVF